MNLRYLIFDISLSLYEQTLTDSVVRPFVVDNANESSDDARAAIRLNHGSGNSVLVYRLPVMRNWANFPESLEACIKILSSKAADNNLNAQIAVWSENFKIRYKILKDPNREFENEGVQLEKIRQAELIKYLDSEGVFLEHSGDALFDLPSNQFSDYFLRIGNLQSKRSFLAAVYFWSIEYLEEVRHIFCDTWSISTTCAILAEFLNLYRQPQILDTPERLTSWSFSPAYLPNSDIAKYLLLEAKDLANQKKGRLLVISSFYSSGKLEQAISQEILGSNEEEKPLLIAIYNSGKNFPNSILLMCDVEPLIAQKGLKGKSAERFPTTELLNVNALTFFPDYRVPEVNNFVLKDIDSSKNFFDTYKGEGIFSVHKDGQNFNYASRDSWKFKSRHHAFHIDADKLFKDSSFREKLNNILDTFSEPFDCVLLDESTTAESLLEAVKATRSDLFESAIIVKIADWRALNEKEEFLEIVNTAEKRTLILVPTVISGQSIGALRRQLRGLVVPERNSGLHFLIGLLRPDSMAEVKNYTQTVKYFGESWSAVVEQIILPDWGKKECPWCREAIELDRVLERNRNEPNDEIFDQIADRLEILNQSKEAGLNNKDVFFSVDGQVPLPFNPGSLFQDIGPREDDFGEADEELSGNDLTKEFIRLTKETDVNEGDLCLIVASAMQNWRIRSISNSLRRPAIDATSILHPDKFNEARLRAALWRCLLPTEKTLAVRADKTEDFNDLLIRVFGDDYEEHHSCLKFELLLSFARDIGITDSALKSVEASLFCN